MIFITDITTTKNISYFDRNFNYYSYDSKHLILDTFYYRYISGKKMLRVLDMGGGCGTFCTALKDNFPDYDITLIDPSTKMLSQCIDSRIRKLKGCLPDDLHLSQKFDVIFLRYVLHHLTGRSVHESGNIVRSSLNNLKKFLEIGGTIIITETIFEGYIYPPGPKYLVFYLLKLQNKFRIKLPYRRFHLDLSVCFYTRQELLNLFNECGLRVVDVKYNLIKGNFIMGMILDKWGTVDFILMSNTLGGNHDQDHKREISLLGGDL